MIPRACVHFTLGMYISYDGTAYGDKWRIHNYWPSFFPIRLPLCRYTLNHSQTFASVWL